MAEIRQIEARPRVEPLEADEQHRLEQEVGRLTLLSFALEEMAKELKPSRLARIWRRVFRPEELYETDMWVSTYEEGLNTIASLQAHAYGAIREGSADDYYQRVTNSGIDYFASLVTPTPPLAEGEIPQVEFKPEQP